MEWEELSNFIMFNYKRILDNEINKLEQKDYLKAIDVLIVSPRFFKRLQEELGTLCTIKLDKEQNIYYIEYRDLIIIASDIIKGTFIMPYFNIDVIS